MFLVSFDVMGNRFSLKSGLLMIGQSLAQSIIAQLLSDRYSTSLLTPCDSDYTLTPLLIFLSRISFSRNGG